MHWIKIKMKFFTSVALICVISVACGHGAHLNKVDDEQGSKTASYLGEFKYLYKTYQDCAASDLSTCLKLKLYTAINRLARSNGDFKVSNSVTFVKDEEEQPAADEEEAPKTESEIESELPRSLEDKNQALNSLIFDKIVSFFENHTLKVSKFRVKAAEVREKRVRLYFENLFIFLALSSNFHQLKTSNTQLRRHVKRED